MSDDGPARRRREEVDDEPARPRCKKAAESADQPSTNRAVDRIVPLKEQTRRAREAQAMERQPAGRADGFFSDGIHSHE